MEFLTPPQVAKRLKVGADKVLGWIHSGELQAVNVAASARGKRPRWRVSTESIDAFLIARSVKLATGKRQPQRKPKKHYV